MDNANKKPLTTDVPQLHTLVYELDSQVQYLKEQIQLLVQRQFGAKADHVDINQTMLFDSGDSELIEVDTETDLLSSKDASRSQSKQSKHMRVWT